MYQGFAPKRAELKQVSETIWVNRKIIESSNKQKKLQPQLRE